MSLFRKSCLSFFLLSTYHQLLYAEHGNLEEAKTAQLSWKHEKAIEQNIVQFKIYYGEKSRNLSSDPQSFRYDCEVPVSVKPGSATGEYTGGIVNLKPDTTYFVCVTALNSSESGQSDEISFRTKPAMPKIENLVFQQNDAKGISEVTLTTRGGTTHANYQVQGSNDLAQWKTLTTFPNTNPKLPKNFLFPMVKGETKYFFRIAHDPKEQIDGPPSSKEPTVHNLSTVFGTSGKQNKFSFNTSGTKTNQFYFIEGSRDLSNWTPLQNFQAKEGLNSVEVPFPSGESKYFIRLKTEH